MRAELLLRIAADLNAVGQLTNDELCELLTDASPPAWAFEEAARRTGDERVLAHLVSHPKTNAEVLERALRFNTSFLDRLEHHVNVCERKQLEPSDIFANLIPEEVKQPLNNERLEHFLASYLPPLCLEYLSKKSPEKLDIPRTYSPLARFILLGDFVHHLGCALVETPNDLPVLAKVALALNPHQSLEPYLNDADIRVRRAAKERASWTGN